MFVFPVLLQNQPFLSYLSLKRFTLNSYIDNAENFLEMIGECVSKTLSLFPSARASDFKYFVMFSGKGRNTLRNSTGVFARKDWSNDDAGSSKKKRWQTLDLTSMMQERERILRAERIYRKEEEIMELWDRTHRKFDLSSDASEDRIDLG